MTNFWRRWKQPWSRSQAARRYIEADDNISIKALAADSGLAERTLERWASQEDWVEQRRTFGGDLAVTTQAKIIEKTSDKLSEEFSNIAIANYNAHRLVRDYAIAVFQVKAADMQNILQSNPSDRMAMLKSNHSPHEMNYWSQILMRATQGIENATGLPYYININTAAQKLNSAGYVVMEATEEGS
ncbi:MAG: hypothetical protein KME54_28920 [Tolypothrix brevis GSE-NOS-MK-07-07A]|nr:hypothetical protein [Tolypothrix brevis GSE-NOS-MK-07-07A]